LAERHDVALDRLEPLERRALGRHQLIADRQERLGDDVKARGRHQVMDIRHPAGDRVLDRDHAEIGVPARDRREGVLESRARHRLVARIGLVAGDVRVRPGLALEHDGL